MTTRRAFITGLLASAATGAAGDRFPGWSHTFQGAPLPYLRPTRIWFAPGMEHVHWSELEDHACWSPVLPVYVPVPRRFGSSLVAP